ncbi:UNVERIFIED_CONTAM: hypothetical protein Sindi_2681400 [Sesamum indicum]
MEQISIQIGLLQRAVSNCPVVAHDPIAGLRIPEPKAYEVLVMRRRSRTSFLTWNSTSLRQMLRMRQGRRELRKLEHTGSVRKYVKAFSVLMLNIRDMSEKDKLFTFMEGLKSWAHLELQCQRASPAKVVEPQAFASGENDSEENEDNLGAVFQWCSTLSQVAAKKVVPPLARKTAPALTASQSKEDAQPRNPRKKGLMFVDVKTHGNPICAMIDTGASHNYLTSAKVARLELVVEKGVGRVKAINSTVQPIAGVPNLC